VSYSGNELYSCDVFLRQALLADAALVALVGDRIYCGKAPKGAIYPLVRFDHNSGRDQAVVGAIRVGIRPVYLIRAVTEDGAWDELAPIAGRIDYVFAEPKPGGTTGASGRVAPQFAGDPGLKVTGSHRQSALRYTQPGGDGQFLHLGGLYRLFAEIP
jgi:hypothetical protein